MPLSKNRQLWKDQILEQENLLPILQCFSARGLATCKHIEELTGLTERQVRLGLNNLKLPGKGMVPLLRMEKANLQSQRGQPRIIYLLTQDGSTVLRHLDPCACVVPPALTDRVELAHALGEMDVSVKAHQDHHQVEIEKQLFIEGNSHIRADILVTPAEGLPFIIEIEQAARGRDSARIVDKLERLVRFMNSSSGQKVSHDLRILFNLPPDDTQTIPIWQEIITEVAQSHNGLPFRVFWKPILDFLKHPEWTTMDGFHLFTPLISETQKENDQVQTAEQPENGFDIETRFPGLVRDGYVDMREIQTIMRVLDKASRVEFDRLSLMGMQRVEFFETMEFIYEASHYRGGPVNTVAAFPRLSLLLLGRFLHAHQNQALLRDLILARRNVQSNLNRGVNTFRDALTRMYWDVFLRYFDFGRGGPLEVRVRVPGFDDYRSDIYVQVSISSNRFLSRYGEDPSDHERRNAEAALAWVLEALWIYGEELALYERRGHPKR